eukprot:scaffold56054_cov61-Phaeocystis_antarctica.AAC.3
MHAPCGPSTAQARASWRHEIDAQCRAEPVALAVAADALRLDVENKVVGHRPAVGSPKLLLAPDRASGCLRPRSASANQPVRPRWPATQALVLRIQMAHCTGLVFDSALNLTEAPFLQQFSHVPPERRK